MKGVHVDIGEVSSTTRALDGEALLSKPTLDRIVAAVVNAMRESGERGERAADERRITGGVSAERDAES